MLIGCWRRNWTPNARRRSFCQRRSSAGVGSWRASRTIVFSLAHSAGFIDQPSPLRRLGGISEYHSPQSPLRLGEGKLSRRNAVIIHGLRTNVLGGQPLSWVPSLLTSLPSPRRRGDAGRQGRGY